MTRFLRPSIATFAVASVLAGAAVPAFADGYYSGIDPHHPPGTQNRVFVPMVESPYFVERVPSGVIYVDPVPTGSIYVEPAPIGSLGGTPAQVRERYRNEYHGSDEGDYYQGLVPPAPVP
ncbi:MAG TPA: hypothetical protein VD840_10425 [Sinorhizobium sp.]|nr:hypothetical protein [Sinorhizobium sp.]